MIPLLKFLVVDDVPDNRFLVTKSLLKKFPGSLVQECEESTPAIAAAQHDRLSAIVVHRGLDVDGSTIVALLRRVNPSVPIIMVSGRECCPAAIEAGANAFLNYESWQRIGALVEQTLAEERAKARPSNFPFIAIPPPEPALAPLSTGTRRGDDTSTRVARILYVEDDPSDVELLRETLAVEGITAEIDHVSTPQEYSAALKGSTPRIILADGRVSGFPTTAALDLARAWCPQVPFFSLSGSVSEDKKAVLRAAGAAGCLSKQDLSNVSDVIRRTLAGREDAR